MKILFFAPVIGTLSSDFTNLYSIESYVKLIQFEGTIIVRANLPPFPAIIVL